MQGKRFLHVEDDGDLRNFVGTVVRMEGGTMLVRENGRQGLLAIQQEGPFDLVIVDLGLPDVSGWELLRALGSLYSLPEDLPVVIFTASAGEQDRERALAMGASDYLLKPLGAVELRDCLRRRLPRLPSEC
ncbi:MAG: response regulator [Dehalococcoidia bacterium]